MLENPMLNEEERILGQTAPEECLRQFVARGGLSLDDAVAALPPQVAAAVRVIVTGERVTPEARLGRLAETAHGGTAARSLEAPFPAGAPPASAPEWTRVFADAYPEFVRRFEARPAVPDEALKTPLPAAEGPAVPDEALKTPLPAAEGLAVPDEALKTPLPAAEGPAVPDEALKGPLGAGEASPQPPEWVRGFAAAFPRLFALLEKGRMTPHEAVETIRTIDGFLGNYPTGARYAAP